MSRTSSASASPDSSLGSALILADNQAIARLAPQWAVHLASVGRPYRVRLLSIGSPSELEAVAAEATAFAADVIIAAGSERLQASAAQVATLAGLPLVVWDDSEGG